MRILLAIGLALALATSASHAQESQPLAVAKPSLTYKQAYKKAKEGNKPLLVLVTADWCPPCRHLKATTLPTLMEKDAFRNFHFAMMDYDSDPKVADQLIEDRGLPQLIMFKKSEGKWLRSWLNADKGIHSVEGVEFFMAKAGTMRLASVEEEKTEKK